MEVIIKETGKIVTFENVTEELEFNLGELVQSNEDGLYELEQDDFNWWQEYTNNVTKAEELKEKAEKKCGKEIVEKAWTGRNICGDIADIPLERIAALNELLER